MSLNASNYSKNRANKLALTQKRIKNILSCTIISYERIIADGVKFDYKKKGKVKHEDYLRNRLVDDYLGDELSSVDIGTEYFTVNKEVTEEYISLVDTELHNDPIDIHIVDKALKKSWGKSTKPYFAIECKRIGSISEYVKDTKKFTERSYTRLRLPIEGQLGFIEKKGWDHKIVSDKIKKNLTKNTVIKTTQNLTSCDVKSGFAGTYISEHEKRDSTLFTVFHLFFDYSKIVLN